MVHILGKMAENLKDNGLIIACMDKGYISGKMEGNMMEILIWMLNKGMVHIFGLMEDNISDIGI